MKFFDERQNEIECSQWLSTYLRYYYLDGPKWNGRPRNQTSRFVEGHVSSLLAQGALLSRGDIEDVMAWKLGLVDHRRSRPRDK